MDNNGAAVPLLTIKDYRNPVIEFQSRKNLKAVVSEPILRKKLGKFLSCHFAWKSSTRIVVYDDFEPYSFFFREERQTGMGICGGIILHDRNNLKKRIMGCISEDYCIVQSWYGFCQPCTFPLCF